jgi:hypothetical protein
MPVQTQMQVRRGTASSWTSTNPILAAGELGFETDTGKFKIGTGASTWTALLYAGGGQSTLTTYQYTATASQTTFSGADSNALTLAYTVGSIQVYLNGALLANTTDYAATTGTSVVLSAGAGLGDSLTILSLATFTVANTYTQAQSDALFIPDSIVDAKGDLIAATAADTVSRIAIGANDTVLTADSAEATGMKWAAAGGGGGMTLISTTEANNTASTYTISSIPTTYNSLLLIGINISSGSGTSQELLIELNGDTGTNYAYVGFGFEAGGVQNIAPVGDVNFPLLGLMARQADAVIRRGSFMAWINNASSATKNKGFDFSTGSFANGAVVTYKGSGKWNNTSAAVTSLRFFTTGANIQSGTFLLYGLS